MDVSSRCDNCTHGEIFESSFSIDSTAELSNSCSDMIERKYVFVSLWADDLSRTAVLTTMVRAIVTISLKLEMFPVEVQFPKEHR